MKIVITNLYSAANRGDAAIVKGMKNALEAYFPNSEFIVLSKSYETAQAITGIKSYPPLIDRLKFFGYFRLFYFLLWAYLYRKKIKLPTFGKAERIKSYLDADLILSVGGGYLNDNYPVAMIRWLFEFYFGKLLGKKVIIYASSVGPFNESWLKPFVRFVFNKLDLITLRDPQSKDVLDPIGISSSRIHVTADAAWSMEPLGRDEGFKLLSGEVPDISNERLKVSISVRRWGFYKGDSGESHKRYIKAITALVDHLVRNRGAEVFLLSTCTAFGGYSNDDRVVADEIVRNTGNSGVRILRGEYLPEQLSAIYANMNIHIGTRMHSNILAMLSGTPVVAIQYEPKTKGMMDSFGLGDWVMDIEQISSEGLIRMVDKAIEKRDLIKSQIAKKLPELKKRSKDNARLVHELFLNGT
ncbi:MAG TPA: polysaccharide pyruvyl transferase family protein [Thermodesulfobacteriota bacterium]|nr:polysaccharide pyruvyl transferase family protein [Thermodesulfobacteriota bacterium]